MTNIDNYPLIDGFETTLAQEWDGATGTVYLNTAPSFTFPSGFTTCIVSNPGKANMQVGIIDGLDTDDKTVNVSSVTVEKGAGVNYSQETHSVGSVVRISNNYHFWSNLVTAINTKVDGDTQPFPSYADATARDAAITSPLEGMFIKNTAEGVLQAYVGGAWLDIDTGTVTPNADTSTAGKVELATQAEHDAGTATGGTGASLSSTPAVIQAGIQKGSALFTEITYSSANTYTTTMTPTLSAYTEGQEFVFKVAASKGNTGAATINIDSIGAKSLVDEGGNALASGMLVSETAYNARYDGTNFVVLGLIPTDANVSAGTSTALRPTVEQMHNHWNGYTIVDGSGVFQEANTEGNSSSTSYVKVKEIEVNHTGTISVSYEMRRDGGINTAYARVYKNGAAEGTENTDTTSSYETYTDNAISVTSGDLIQLYVRVSSGSIGVYYKNFKILAAIKPNSIDMVVNLN